MSAQQYVVVAGSGFYGPFPTREKAAEWALHPDRSADVRFSSTVMPLFGGVLLDDESTYHAQAERCYRPGCDGWVTGASDFCSPECEQKELRRWTGVPRP